MFNKTNGGGKNLKMTKKDGVRMMCSSLNKSFCQESLAKRVDGKA